MSLTLAAYLMCCVEQSHARDSVVKLHIDLLLN